MKHLIFKIDGQSLVRRDSFKPATDSVEYLTVSFEFSSDWSGTTKTAKFRKDSLSYPAVIKSDNTCIVPYEVLVRDIVKGTLGKQYFYMTVEGVNGTRKITTDEVKIEIIPSGTGTITTPNTPTADVYAQYVDEVKSETQASADSALQSAETAKTFAQSAEASANSLKNDYSNALKGYASGSVVRVDDTSPVEHYPSVKVHGKNLFKYGTLNFTKNQVIVLDEPIPVGTYTISTLITSSDIDGELSSVSINNGYEVLKYVPLRRNERVSATFTVTKPITKLDFCAGYNYNQGADDLATWADIQIEKGETATEYIPYIDPSTVKVTRCGKNLLNLDYIVNGNSSTSAIENNKLTVTGYFATITTSKLKPGERCTISFNSSRTGDKGGGLSVEFFDETDNRIQGVYKQNDLSQTISFTIPGNTAETRFYFYGSGSSANVTDSASYTNILLESGGVKTGYESFNGVDYTPNADGTVEGITSFAPTMTLLTDTENTTVEVEYNRDINVVIADILAKLS